MLPCTWSLSPTTACMAYLLWSASTNSRVPACGIRTPHDTLEIYPGPSANRHSSIGSSRRMSGYLRQNWQSRSATRSATDHESLINFLNATFGTANVNGQLCRIYLAAKLFPNWFAIAAVIEFTCADAYQDRALPGARVVSGRNCVQKVTHEWERTHPLPPNWRYLSPPDRHRQGRGCGRHIAPYICRARSAGDSKRRNRPGRERRISWRTWF